MARIMLVLSVTSVLSGAPGIVAPAHACNGDVCDWVCQFQNEHPKPLGPCHLG